MHAVEFFARFREESGRRQQCHQRTRFGTVKRSAGMSFVCHGRCKKDTRREKRRTRMSSYARACDFWQGYATWSVIVQANDDSTASSSRMSSW